MAQACRSSGWLALTLLLPLALLLGSDPDSAAGTASERLAPEQVAVSGIINEAAGPSFRLRYGAGEISVILEGRERFREADAPPVMSIGERVTIFGGACRPSFSCLGPESI